MQGRIEIDVIQRFRSGADLLIDATAEIGVQQALAASAEEIAWPSDAPATPRARPNDV